MGASRPADASARTSGILPIQRPRWAFWKGLLTGAAIEIPLLAATVWALAHLGFGNPDTELMRIIRLTAVFAGVAALLTAGGIGRLAAHVYVQDEGPRDGQGDGPGDGPGEPASEDPADELGRRRRRAVLRAARAHAVAGAGLVLIAAIPHGRLPEAPTGWLAFAAGGLVCGAVAGALIGYVCSGPSIFHLADVWSLARRPRVALRQLLSPEELARLGSALRTRTTDLFDGIFDPAPPPPRTIEPREAEREAERSAGRDDPAVPREPAAAEAPPPSPRSDA
ncbi:MAG TPA: hypothetical protein VNO30_40285 [Kofleriaceae bacterium]|nr:hypothetical protein [Kofleriaceae bacterium]